MWRHRVHRLSASELANVKGKIVQGGFWLIQDWGSYRQPSTAYIDDTAVLVTRPIYDYAVYPAADHQIDRLQQQSDSNRTERIDENHIRLAHTLEELV